VNEADSNNQQATSTRTSLRRGFRFALVGLVFGFLGLGTAAYRMSVESEQPPPPKRKEVSDVLADTIKKTADKFLKQPAPPPPASQQAVAAWPVAKKLGLAASVLGFIGAAFGCVSWLVGEHRRWTWAALCVGVAALAWTHVVVAVSIAVAIVIGLWLLSQLG
jgi:VIT1/CCC1 family predicted Fe2+/Mn2+ transporter